MTTTQTAATKVAPEQIDNYRRDGFVLLPGLLNAEEVERFRSAAEHAYHHGEALNPNDPMFRQVVNVWRSDDVLRDLTFHPRLAEVATQLAGVPLRIWHDHLLMKRPHNGTPTEYHQDAPLWPHSGSRHSLSAWVALVDVPVERGCMTFIPAQQDRRDIRAVDLTNSTDLFEAAPDLVYTERVTVPLRAGDVTFHNGYTPHTANANDTDEYRYAHVNIYLDREARFNGRPHPCTDGLGLKPDDALPEDLFPPVPLPSA